ncbi:MAG: diguanylate cyclase [Bacillota bacterium]
MQRLIKNLYILAFIFIIIFFSAWYYHYHGTNQQLQENARKAAETTVLSKCEKINGWLCRHSQTIEAAGSFIALKQWSDQEILDYLESLLDDNESFASIYFGTPDNEIINANGWDPPPDFNLTERPWYNMAKEKGGTVFTKVFTNASSDEVIFTIARPVYCPEGKFLGVVGGDITIKEINQLIKTADNGREPLEGKFSFLIDGEGHLLAHPDLDYNPHDKLVTFEEKYGKKQIDSIDNGVVRLNIEEKEGYLAFTSIEGTPWQLASFISFSVFTESSAKMTTEFVFAGIASLLIVIMFMAYNHIHVHKPLLQLESSLKKIEIDKDLSYRPPAINNSELATLGKTINNLLDKAEDYFNQLTENEKRLKETNLEMETMLRKLTTAEEALDYSEEKLYYLSYHDQLTGVYNRSFFEAKLKFLADDPNYPITIISVDVDGLKLINDTLGHEAGDKLLKNCANILKEIFDNNGILGRVGGDEFTVILPLTGKNEGECLARQIRYQVKHYNLHNSELPLSLSMGVATAESDATSIKRLVKQADDLMFRDKLHRSKSARNGVVQSLTAALAERDFITEGHIERLEELCMKFANKINLDSKQISDLALLVQVHDLGKVAIPDHILYKPGPLTEEEWEIMKLHPEKGSRIASSSTDLAGIAYLILSHHEHWSGQGYPLGLKGAEIPLECRILSICDAFDVMTHDRPYRKAVSPREALEEIEMNSGTQFDPELAHVFLSFMMKKQKI